MITPKPKRILTHKQPAKLLILLTFACHFLAGLITTPNLADAATPTAPPPQQSCFDFLDDSGADQHNAAEHTQQFLNPILGADKKIQTEELSITQETVHHIDTIKDPIVGQRLVLHAPQGQWLSNYRSQKSAPQLDPRIFVSLVGPDVALLFGFSQIDKKTILVPDAERLNWAIEKINARLKAKGLPLLSFMFYTQAASDHDDHILYLKNVAKRSLPIALSGPMALHDIAAHLWAILKPPQAVEHLALQAELYVEFQKWFTQKNRYLPSKIQDRLYEAFRETEKRIDLLTGNPSTVLMQFYRNRENPNFTQHQLGLYGFLPMRTDETPLEVIVDHIFTTVHPTMPKLTDEEKNSSKIIRQLLDEFQLSLAQHPKFEKFSRMKLLMDKTEYSNHIFAQIQNLKDIARELNINQPNQ